MLQFFSNTFFLFPVSILSLWELLGLSLLFFELCFVVSVYGVWREGGGGILALSEKERGAHYYIFFFLVV